MSIATFGPRSRVLFCSMLCSAATILPMQPAKAQQQPVPTNSTPASSLPTTTNPQVSPQAPSANSVPNSLENGVLSVSGGRRLLKEAMTAASAQNYDLAVAKIQDSRQVFNQLSNFYQELSKQFDGIDNRIADRLRKRAIDTAQERDGATYQLALIYRAKNQPELSVPLLIQLIRSQSISRELGLKSYQQLVEIGFVEDPYPRPSGSSPQS
ncbi:MAG: hypothetical protein ACK456_04735 [Pseudanabaenaceae cyanobacterium]|jgi:hypothetical protein